MKLRKDPKYIYWGLTALCVVVLSVIIAAVLRDFSGFYASCKRFLGILSPVIYGIASAYILNPVMKFFERCLLKLLRGRKMSEKTARSLSRGLSVALSMLFGIAVIYGFFALLLPNLVDSIAGIVANMSEYYKTVQNWLQNLSVEHPEYSGVINTFTDKVFEGLETWFQERVLNNLQNLVVTVTSQVFVVIKGAMNVLIGVVASIYMLSSKEKFQAQAKKIIVALMKRERADRLLEVGCVEALNFDGGQTAVMTFMGNQITRIGKYDGKTSARTTTEILGIGHSELIDPSIKPTYPEL